MEIHNREWFEERLWGDDLTRINNDTGDKSVDVTCTEENIDNLINSQTDPSFYGFNCRYVDSE